MRTGRFWRLVFNLSRFAGVSAGAAEAGVRRRNPDTERREGEGSQLPDYQITRLLNSRGWLYGSAARKQVNHRHDEGDYQQQVNKRTGYMKSPSQEPQNNQDRENGPQHRVRPRQNLEINVSHYEKQTLRPELSHRNWSFLVSYPNFLEKVNDQGPLFWRHIEPAPFRVSNV